MARALITGASEGIGRQLAIEYSGAGYDIVAVARDQGRLQSLAEILPTSAEILPADLTTPEGLASVERRLDQPDIDVLINNAGFGSFGKYWELDADKELEQIDLNVGALTRLTHAALGPMVERNSRRIVNIASIAGLYPVPGGATYGATKASVVSFTKALAYELRATNVRATVVCPGYVFTEFQKRAGLGAERRNRFLWLTPKQVARATRKSSDAGRTVCIPGIHYKLAALLAPVVPRKVGFALMGSWTRRPM